MSVEPLTADRVDEAARILAAAFSTDPVFAWMAGRSPIPPDRLRHCFASVVASELRRPEPEASIASDGGCVAVWHGIDQWKTGPVESLRIAPGFVRSFGIRRVPALLRMDAAIERAHPSEPHHYLGFIGTDPARQGSGLGSTTLRPMLERCDREGVAAYLESSNPANDAFYVRHGFEVTRRLDLPDGAPPVNAMWREPRT